MLTKPMSSDGNLLYLSTRANASDKSVKSSTMGETHDRYMNSRMRSEACGGSMTATWFKPVDGGCGMANMFLNMGDGKDRRVYGPSSHENLEK